LKTALIISTLIIIFLGWLLFDTKTTNETEIKAERQAKEHHKKLADSLERRARIQSDSLELMFATIRSLNAQTQEAREVTNVWRKKYLQEKANKIGIKTESEYDSILAVLFDK